MKNAMVVISVRDKRRERGHAVVELAFVWSFLWLLATGVYQFGNAFYVYSRLETAASNAAMLASRLNYDVSDSGASFKTKVKNMAVYGDPNGGTTPLAPNLTTANVDVNHIPSSFPTGVTVTIQNYTITNLFHDITLTNKPRVTVAYMGSVVCSGC